jgi:hypothetical protein
MEPTGPGGSQSWGVGGEGTGDVMRPKNNLGITKELKSSVTLPSDPKLFGQTTGKKCCEG